MQVRRKTGTGGGGVARRVARAGAAAALALTLLVGGLTATTHAQAPRNPMRDCVPMPEGWGLDCSDSADAGTP